MRWSLVTNTTRMAFFFGLNKMNNLKTFEFKPVAYSIRTVVNEGEVWFVAKDVCNALNIANSRDALSRLDDDEKGVGKTDTLGGIQDMAIVNESGLYNLIFTSNKPEAKAFRKWVTSEVLPSIRKTGQYGTKPQMALLSSNDEQEKILDYLSKHSLKTSREIAQNLKGVKPFNSGHSHAKITKSIRYMIELNILGKVTDSETKSTYIVVL